ncbi:hypothetical protein LTR86_009563 [Recurvomyces mirabilis]|nr:hypothetical protein LTR86_009563 [Recurvomyces mirabilis]
MADTEESQNRKSSFQDRPTEKKQPMAEPGNWLRQSASPLSVLFLDTIVFHVGPDSSPFTLHTGILIDRCPAFAEHCLGGDVVEERLAVNGRECELPSDAAVIFNIVLVWLYTDSLVLPEGPNSKYLDSIANAGDDSDSESDSDGDWRRVQWER